MTSTDAPADAAQRLDALRRTGLLDGPPSASFDRLTRLATELLDVPVALVSLVDADRQFFASCVGLPADVTAERQTPLSHSFCAHVVDRGDALVISDAREHPVLRDNLAIADLNVIAYLGIPISHPDGTVIGSFCAIDGEPRDWSERDIELMRDLAASVDTEIALHVTVEGEREARRDAEDANRHLRVLAEVSGALAESLDWQTTIETMARLVVPDLADWCAVDLVEAGHVRRLTLAHSDEREAERLRLTRYPPRLDEEAGVAEVLRTGRAVVVDVIDDAYLDLVVQNDDHRSSLQALGTGSAAIVPLHARGRTIGALSFVARRERRYTPALLPMLSDLGRRAALAIENARLYQSAEDIARTLQASLLPPQLPDIPDVELARHYRASGRGNEVGGDFYDVFEVPDGRWLAVVGDVVGKGPAAAATTGLARHTLRAAAMRETAPSRILDILNDVLLAEADAADADGVFATVCAALLERTPEGLRCTLSSGGHPAPLVRRADGAIALLDVPGTVLGIVEAAVLDDRTVLLEPGDTLLLYTDGVTEARRPDGRFLDDDGLLALVAEAADDAAGLVAHLAVQVEAYQQGSARDDVALLAVRALPAG
jgi:serine phosphatase RsbU (regulator of sigma subunit)